MGNSIPGSLDETVKTNSLPDGAYESDSDWVNVEASVLADSSYVSTPKSNSLPVSVDASIKTDKSSGYTSKSDFSRGCLLQIRQEPNPALHTAGAIGPVEEQKIMFGHWKAADKYVKEKHKAVRKAKQQIATRWYEIDDHVYAIAADPIQGLDRIVIAQSGSPNDEEEDLRIMVSQLTIEARFFPLPVDYQERSVAVSMHIAATKCLSKLILERRKPKGAPSNKDIAVRADGNRKELDEWGWSSSTNEESWEDLGFKKDIKQVGWLEQYWREKCRVERSSITIGCYKPSLLRWSLTAGEQ